MLKNEIKSSLYTGEDSMRHNIIIIFKESLRVAVVFSILMLLPIIYNTYLETWTQIYTNIANLASCCILYLHSNVNKEHKYLTEKWFWGALGY